MNVKVNVFKIAQVFKCLGQADLGSFMKIQQYLLALQYLLY
jgi:hypothetical protein